MLLNVSIILISLQLIHLTWLTFNVTLPILFNIDYLKFNVEQDYIIFIIFIGLDYLEIPALIITLTYYLTRLKNGVCKGMSTVYIFILILQFIHILWLTDEYILQHSNVLPLYIVVIVILIDYLELTVLYNLIKNRINKFK